MTSQRPEHWIAVCRQELADAKEAKRAEEKALEDRRNAHGEEA